MPYQRSSASRQFALKLSLGFGAVIVLLMVTVFLVSSSLFTRIQEKEENRLSSALAVTLNESITRVSFSGKYHARLLAEEMLARVPELAYISVESLDGRIIAHSDPRLNDQRVSAEDAVLDQHAGGLDSPLVQERPYGQSIIKEIVLPFRSGSNARVVGVIRLGVNVQQARLEQRNSLIRLLGLMASLSVIAMGLVYLLSRHFGRTVNDLADQLQGVLDNAPMAIAISDSNGQILAQSFEFKRLFGPPNTGKPFLQHLAENLSGAQSAGLTDLSRHVFESGDHAEQEIRVKHHGDLSDWHVSIFPIASDSRGRVSNVCSVIEDITDRKRAEEALRKSEAHTRALISAIPDLIFTNRRDGEFLAVHAPDPKWLFLPAEAFLHQKVEDVLPRPLSDQFMAAFANALDSAAVQELNYSLPMGDQERHFEARVAPCAGDTVITIVRDITERKQAEEERRNIQAQLLQTQKMESLGSLAGGVAHDMNNVLGAILFLSSANLETLPAESPASRAFDTISKAAIRGGQMVKSLLGFARQSPAEKRELDVNLILREEIRLLEHTTLAKVHLELELAPDLRPICGDASALAHAFMNLCVNAVDAMPEHGTLTLRTRNVDNGWIEVAVEDTGCGMSKDVLEKALDPFFTTKEQGKGTGLGLSVVYRTVQAHQGQLELQSEPSQGTRVKMRFPVCGLGTLIPEPAKETLSSPSREALHILLVDDDELIRSSIQAILEAIGHITTTVVSGEEALAKLEAGIQPDLVILDMNMPGLGGGGTLPRLRALRPTLPVLLATGRADQKVLDLVEAYPGVTLLPKPFTLADIQQNIRSYKASRPVRVQPLS